MNDEARIGYLCTLAARSKITLDEECELFGYIALDPHILDLIYTEILLREMYEK